MNEQQIIGRGIYAPSQAARLIGATSQKIFRWVKGTKNHDPLVRPHYAFLDDSYDLDFLDLIELRIVNALRNKGVSLQAIRYAYAKAERIFEGDRPFATQRFKTDGHEILAEDPENEAALVSLKKGRPGQGVFTAVVEQSLSDVEYEDDRAARWRPSIGKDILVDPNRAFGEPILEAEGISSAVIKRDYDIFEDVAYLADIYEIPKKRVRDAINFEKALDNRETHPGSV